MNVCRGPTQDVYRLLLLLGQAPPNRRGPGHNGIIENTELREDTHKKYVLFKVDEGGGGVKPHQPLKKKKTFFHERKKFPK